MKKGLLCALFIVVLFGCGGAVLVKENPFNKSKDIELKTWHKVIDGNLDNLEALYTSEIKDGRRTPTKVKFHFQAGAMMGAANPFAKTQNVPLDPTAQILVDNNSYTLKLYDTQKDTTLSIQGNRYGVYGGTYNDLYCTMTLTPEIEHAIQTASKVMYRFSAGGEATTLIAKPAQLKSLKEFMSIK